MIKYVLEENLIALDGSGIEPGYDHCIESWDENPKEEDIIFWIKESINRHWKTKKVHSIYFTLFKIDEDEDRDEWTPVKEYFVELDRSKKISETIIKKSV